MGRRLDVEIRPVVETIPATKNRYATLRLVGEEAVVREGDEIVARQTAEPGRGRQLGFDLAWRQPGAVSVRSVDEDLARVAGMHRRVMEQTWGKQPEVLVEIIV